MSDTTKTEKAFQDVNLAIELIIAGTSIVQRITDAQQKREAEGRQITREDLGELFTQGDHQRDVERATLAAAQLAQRASLKS